MTVINMNNHVYDVIIVGGGPGGYTAALYAARVGFDTIVLEKLSAGGQMALTHQIDNYPGFKDGIDVDFLLQKKCRSKRSVSALKATMQKSSEWIWHPHPKWWKLLMAEFIERR